MEEKCEGSAASVQRSVEDTAPCSLEKDDAVQCVDQYDILGYSEEQFQQEEELWARWSQSLNERRQIDRRVPQCKADSTLHQKADWTSSGQAGFTQVLLKRPGRSRGMHVLHRSCHRNWANESRATAKAFIESGPRFFAPSFMEPDQQSNERTMGNHVASSTSPKKGIALPACKILLGRGPRTKSASLPRPKAKDPNLLKWYASGERVRDATPDDAEQVCGKRALLYRRISSGDCRVIFGHHRIQCLGAPERERMQIR